jgi:hypothetical protein
MVTPSTQYPPLDRYDELLHDLQNRILTIFAGAHIKPGVYSEGKGVTHVNLLRTIEAMYGLPKSGAQQPNAAGAGISDETIVRIFLRRSAESSARTLPEYGYGWSSHRLKAAVELVLTPLRTRRAIASREAIKISAWLLPSAMSASRVPPHAREPYGCNSSQSASRRNRPGCRGAQAP